MCWRLPSGLIRGVKIETRQRLVHGGHADGAREGHATVDQLCKRLTGSRGGLSGT